MKSLLIIGCGGHGRVVADLATALREYQILGFGDDHAAHHGRRIDDLPVLGYWKEIPADAYVVAIGQNQMRRRIFEKLTAAGKYLPTLISPSACVSPRATLGCGTVVLPRAVVQAGAVIGDNVLLNAGAVIDHDAVIGDHAHVGPNATVASFGRVSPEEFLGSGEVRKKGTRAGAGSREQGL